MSYVQGQRLAPAASSHSQLAEDLVSEQSGSASSLVSVHGGDLCNLMPLEDETDAVISPVQCKGLHGFRTATRVWVATWQDMRKGERVTRVSDWNWHGDHIIASEFKLQGEQYAGWGGTLEVYILLPVGHACSMPFWPLGVQMGAAT